MQMFVTSDTAANDSDKAITVPANNTWRVTGIYATLASSADVGNRILEIELRDAADTVIWNTEHLVAQAASNTWTYLALPGGAFADNSASHDAVALTLPNPCILQAGWDIHVYDSAAVAAAADDLTIHVHYFNVMQATA